MNVVDVIKILAFATKLLPEIMETVREIEATIKAAKAGALKKELVLRMLSEVLDVADDFIKLNRDVVLRMIDRAIDVVVAILNLKGEFKHGVQAENPTPAPPAA